MSRSTKARLPRPGLLFAGLCLLIGCAVLIPRGDSYWNFSDGVYLYSSRALLEGGDLYSGFAAAQPPPLYFAGAAILGISDTIAAARIALFAVNVMTGVMVMIAVRRLTGRSHLAAVAGALALLTPRALHDSAELLPETFAAPLVMVAALAASRSSTAVLGGIAGALAAAFKLSYALPIAAIALAAAAARRYLTGAVAAAIVLAAASLIGFGSALFDNVVDAQRSLGYTRLGLVPSLLAQAAWNLIPFTLPVLAAWVYRARTRDPQLLRTVAMAAAGSLVVFVSILKYGTYINLAVVAEPPLLALGAAGAAWAWEERRRIAERSRIWIGAGVAVLALGALQALSLIVIPSDPFVFTRPAAPSDGGWALSPSAVSREIERINRCPAGDPYSGDPYLAFIAGRRMPGNQGDSFIITAEANREFLRKARADRPVCPAKPATTRNSAILDRR